MEKTTSVLMAGVGGQGIILASDILSEVMLDAGFEVKKSEIHGMAQRGGSVSSHIRFGKSVYSPTIPKGSADFLICFEKLELLRWLDFCKEDTRVIVNDLELNPPMVNLGEAEYPRELFDETIKKFKNLTLVPASKAAMDLGNIRAANVVMIGIFSKFFDVEEKLWLDKILGKLPEKLHDLNRKAFNEGRKLG
ncbi:MAG: indolepyruvate oxidoreductase subunit beta [Deltaproteobacteria bacterium]|nr:MAG: indolepyruvate oxidoreductase subunit beta [Deltaproteobacteria bacterium]